MNVAPKIYPLLSRPGHLVDYFGAKLFVPHGHFDEEHLLSGGIPETHVLDTFKRFVKEGDSVMDVGANIGTHALALAALVGSKGIVFAVEADVDNVASLRTSLAQSSIHNVMLLSVAASDRFGLIRALATTMTNSVFSDRADQQGAKVACMLPLDCIIDQVISFIKIDIEGAELLALFGMSKLIDKNRPSILCEFSPIYIINTLGSDRSAEIFSFFSDRKYFCFYIDPHGALHSCADFQALRAAHGSSLEQFGWNHIDVLFLPDEKSIE